MNQTLPLRELGATGIPISPIGLGALKLGRNQGVKYPKAFDLPSDEDAKALFQLARELGIIHLDTAPAYGISEERLGALVDVSDWLLSTKTGEEFEDGVSRYDFSAEHTRASVARSLERLRVDRLDLVLIHSSGEDEAALAAGALDALKELREAGTLRGIGASLKTVEGGLTAIRQGCDALMVEYNPWNDGMRPVLDAAAENGCGILIKKAFASGHFGSDGGVAEALGFIFDHPAVSSVVLGTLNPDHLRENVAAARAVL